LNAAALRRSLEGFYRAALDAVDPAAAIRRVVVSDARGLSIGGEALPASAHLRLLAVGKAAAAMAAELERLVGDRLEAGLVVTKDGHGLPLARCTLRESAHPVPDARSEAAGRAALALARRGPAPDALVVALSGGASSLWSCPLPGLALTDVSALTAALLAAGAPIDELNTVRKHVCELAGGRLARDAEARRVHVLALSDVPGDRLDVIASGPCAPDPTTYADAREAVARRLAPGAVPAAIHAHLAAGARGEREESPKPGDACFARVRTALLASNATALEAASRAARAAGFEVRAVPGFAGEARDVGRRLAALARAERAGPAPVCIVAGGESTVRVQGDGIGGRSQELALAAAVELAGCDDVCLLAAGTDGSDGPTDAAGAFADGGTLARARAAGLDPGAALARNDSHSFFAAEGGLLRTGPTRTNVMDLVLIGIAPAAANRDYRVPSDS
jgi:glycerate-2-kinase